MSFDIFKTRRSTEYWKESTNTAPRVGPGTYNLNKVPFQTKKIHGIAPFSSNIERFPTSARDKQTDKSQSLVNLQNSFIHVKKVCDQTNNNISISQNPKPNFPQQDSTRSIDSQMTKKGKETASFISRVKRLAPPTARLGCDLPSSNFENPGPGTYDYENKEEKSLILDTMKEFIMEHQKQKKQKMMQAILEVEGEEMLKKKKRIKPTIPGKKLAKNGYTGINEDTPGPHGYNPKSEAVKQKSSSSLFSKSKSNRDVFTINKDHTLGPQSYEIETEKLTKKDHNRLGQTSTFLSKVPNCKDQKVDKADLPGPGAYNPKDHNEAMIEKELEKSRVSEVLQLKNANYFQNAINNSTITRKIECPFVDIESKKSGVGPGNYFYDNAKEKILKRIQKTLNEQITQSKPGFNSHLERDCLRTLEKTQPIGPGSYIDISNPSHSSFNKTLLKFQTDINFKQAYGIGVKPFGSSTERFMDRTNGQNTSSNPLEDMNFGLASQVSLMKIDEDVQKKLEHSMKYGRIRQSKSQGSFQFKSKSKRIFYQDQNDPNIVTINTNIEQNLLNILERNVGHDASVGHRTGSNTYREPPFRQNRLTYQIQKLKNVCFDSSQDRFGINQIMKNTMEGTPGPGAYSVAQTDDQPSTRPETVQRPFQTTERKFNPSFNSYVKRAGTSQRLGPGAYYQQNTMVKKSFNMAIEGSSFV